MRAFIKRKDKEIEEFLQGIETNQDSYFDEEYWLKQSGESFHGEVSDNGNSFMFKDARLPNFEIPLQFVEIE